MEVGKIKILNLYCGIGGNRKLWGDEHEVTAVELDEKIASIYQEFFPNDTVIVADAHQYLLDHYKEFNFIWSSPPCPTHSQQRLCGVNSGQNKAEYPNMMLYQEIILLQYMADKKQKWVIENVIPYYDLLIDGQKRGRHIFWANFYIQPKDIPPGEIKNGTLQIWKEKTGIDLSKYDGIDKRKIYRNCVDSKLGKHIFDCAFVNKQERLF